MNYLSLLIEFNYVILISFHKNVKKLIEIYILYAINIKDPLMFEYPYIDIE